LENVREELFIFDVEGAEGELTMLKRRYVVLVVMGRRPRLEGINGRLRL